MIEHIESLPDFNNQLSLALTNKASNTPVNNQMNQMINDYDKILEDYNKTISLNPELFFGYYNRAFFNLRLHEYQKPSMTLIKPLNWNLSLAKLILTVGSPAFSSMTLKAALLI